MPEKLEDWQKHLANHFMELRRRRSSITPDQPIFGLEHGLNAASRENLANSIRLDIQSGAPNWDHRLAWVVYASEVGYEFSGDEYWQSFDAKTTGWNENGDRHWIRNCFQDFHECYGGAKPTGPWAKHRSIICWPITNAILPFDLQCQLANLLYDLRHRLSPELLQSPLELGNLIAAHSWNRSSRFQQLAEEPLFVGQVSAALILHGNDITSSPIHSSAVERISEDLDRVSRAREWLHGAREGALSRIKFKNIRGQNNAQGRDNDQAGENLKSKTALELEPRIILYPGEEGTWQIRLELPDFSGLLLKFQHIKNILLNSRCWVIGSSGRRKPAGWLLYGRQSIPLIDWPKNDVSLLQFENSIPELESLLNTECLLQPGPVWLFKVASDGLARELKGKTVRPGQKYIALVEEGQEIQNHSQINKIKLKCVGVQAIEFNFGKVISPDLRQVLMSLGIFHIETVLVWPAGLSPSQWDGEGVAEWLSTDTPCVGIRADYHVSSFSLELGVDNIDLVPNAPGEPVFVELPKLEIGLHFLRIKATSDRNVDGFKELGSLEIRIREPRVWTPGASSGSAFFVVADPAVPTLEQLWDGDVQLEVYGTSSRQLKCEVEFFRKGENNYFFNKKFLPLRFPVKSATWQKEFNKQVKESQEAQNAYDAAQSCHVRLGAEELGSFSLIAERDFSPLRWVLRRVQDEFRLKIVDDSGSKQTPQIIYFEFEAPDNGHLIDISSFNQLDGYKATHGLYALKLDNFSCSIIIPREIQGLQDLQFIPTLLSRQKTSEDIINLLVVMEFWSNARGTGNFLSSYMRSNVLRAITKEVFRLIAGNPWAKVEEALQRSDGSQKMVSFCGLIRNPKEINSMEQLGKMSLALAEKTPQERTLHLAEVIDKYFHLRMPSGSNWKTNKEDNLLWLSELVLRLASCSKNTIEWAGGNIHQGISYLRETPSLPRIARFMVFAIANARKTFPDIYDGWLWK